MPTGGWGNQWAGNPGRGFGIAQPGGWIYNVLPYMDETAIHALPKNRMGEAKRQATAQMLTQPVEVFNCPSRRPADLYEHLAQQSLRNSELPLAVPKADYAVNGGDTVLSGGGGPVSAEPRDIRRYQWPSHDDFNGIAFVASRVRNAQITDGTSSTYLGGEKLRYLYPDRIIGDDQTLCIGNDADIRRWVAEPPAQDSGSGEDWNRFGSAHPSGCYFVLCDGSVQLVSYNIDAETHRRLGNRRDGLPNQQTEPSREL